MIIKLKSNASREEMDSLMTWVRNMGLEVHTIEGSMDTVIGLIGDTAHISTDQLVSMNIVESVMRIQEPYKNANRKMHPEDTQIVLENGTKLGAGEIGIIAGPCSVETEEQIIGVARDVKAAGATILRGGAFKPRTSPYSFQGLRGKGVRMLLDAKRETGLPIITEIMDISQMPLFEEIDIIQVGARNMQNFELLKELGRTRKPILLKRGMSSTLQELLMSAEYIMAGGNEQVILCERGIRTFETATRNTLDLSAIPVLKRMTHLPIVIDPSHATGKSHLVEPMAMAAVACGADGLMIEVHNDPPHALCDGAQSLTPAQFADTMRKICILMDAMQNM